MPEHPCRVSLQGFLDVQTEMPIDNVCLDRFAGFYADGGIFRQR